MSQVLLFQKHRKAFWRHNGNGYTQRRSEAGLFPAGLATELASKPKSTTRVITPNDLLTKFAGKTCEQIAEALP